MSDHPAHVLVDSVKKNFGAAVALDAVSLSIARGQIACLVGHSGCGKSTLLRSIAGVERIDGGRIVIGDAVVAGGDTFIEPEHRNVGLMFQDYALFPHLTARQNIAFGLAKLSKAERIARVEGIITKLGIEKLADRFPHMLSGGEQQRIALARALAPQPDVLLMDEPFSNLDRSLRENVRRETVSLVRSLGITAVVVTHDPEEALAVGDIVVLMDQGRVVEAASGEAIYRNPQTPYAAAFFSRLNRIPATAADGRVASPLGTFVSPEGVRGAVEILVRPESLFLSSEGVPATVIGRSHLGEIGEVLLQIPEVPEPLILRTTNRPSVSMGDRVFVSVREGDVLIFPHFPNNWNDLSK